jgi:SAM-dependent methyltransferase
VVLAHEHGLDPLAGTLAELGPGDSLGIGLAAILSGVDVYLALDTMPHAAPRSNLAVLEGLIELFLQRAAVPGEEELPEVQPKLASYRFPHEVLTEERLSRALAAPRLNAIREALGGSVRPDGAIRVDYVAPWSASGSVAPESVDMVISQAVMEHVEDLSGTYRAAFRVLKPGGFMSHNIDFRCHNLTRDWNGHWAIGERTWALVKGARPYLINRMPHSVHIDAMTSAGFRILADLRREGMPLRRRDLARAFRDLSDEDLRTSGALILAVKPSQPHRVNG